MTVTVGRFTLRVSSYLALLFVALAVASCSTAAKDTYWTRKGSDDAKFRKESQRCVDRSTEQLLEDQGVECRSGTINPGTRCGTVNTDDPFLAEQERRRKERRLRYLYGECLERNGWVKNYDGKGYKGRY